MVAAARCLVEPQFSIQSILRAVLRDEMISWHKKVCQIFIYLLISLVNLDIIVNGN